eukprot:g11787.t1
MNNRRAYTTLEDPPKWLPIAEPATSATDCAAILAAVQIEEAPEWGRRWNKACADLLDAEKAAHRAAATKAPVGIVLRKLGAGRAFAI